MAPQQDAFETKDTIVAQRLILVAEDNLITQDLLVLLLSSQGHKVEGVDDGKQAFEALMAKAYDVVFLDFHLPEMEGPDVLKAFNAKNPALNIPSFVAITADMKGLLTHATAIEKFDFYVPKPFSQHDIYKVIEK